MGTSLKAIRVGGVPEHFNMPWHWANETGLFANQGIELKWTDFPGGTGAMSHALRAQELDVAIVLTEGIVADIVNGNPSKIIQFYVTSPLIWGIHVPAHSTIQQVSELATKPFAISRKGSGSHLMASIMGQDLKWDQSKLQYEIVGNLAGARAAMATGKAYGFLWEKFTTQPYVDNGEFRRVGELPTPWPCFSIAVTEAFLNQESALLRKMLQVLNQVCATWKQQERIVERIADRYGLKPDEVGKWLEITEWNTKAGVDASSLDQVLEKLHANQIITGLPEAMSAAIIA
ncbi:MAG: substrate-binding domain-containing protein [Flammeovirgaceae bacterium]